MSKKQRDQLYVEVIRHQQSNASPPHQVQQPAYHPYHQQQYQAPVVDDQYLQQYANISPYMNPYMNPVYVSVPYFRAVL